MAIKKKDAIDIGVKSLLATSGAYAGVIHPLLGVGAAFIVPIFEDIYKRTLSPKELTRIQTAEKLATSKILKQLEEGARPRSGDGIDEGSMSAFIEGSILATRNAYEEKKVPLIANLIAITPFTNTPIENMLNALALTERLTYRQLLLISLFGKAQYGTELDLSHSPLWINETPGSEEALGDETRDGLMMDVMELMSLKVLLQSSVGRADVVNDPRDIIPARLKLGYNGLLLMNSLGLDTLPNDEINDMKRYFKGSESLF